MHRRTQRAAFGLLTLAALLLPHHPPFAHARPRLPTQTATAPQSAPAAAAAIALEAGKPVERGLAGGEVHAYTVALATGQFLHVVAEQRGVDVVVVVFGPDGKGLQEVDSPNGTQGPEPVRVVAKEAGSYRFEVRSLERDAPAGRYEIRIETLRAATNADRTGDFAKRLIAAESEDKRAALLAGEPELVTADLFKALHELGTRHLMRGEHPPGFAAFGLEVKLAEKPGDKSALAAGLSGLGALHEAREEYDAALDYYRKAVALVEQLGDDQQKLAKLARMNYNLGNAHRFKGDYASGLEHYRKSQALYEGLGDKTWTVITRNSVGLSHNLLGDYAPALDLFRQSMAELEASGDKANMAETLNYIGGVYGVQGRYAPAMETFQRALRIMEEARNPYGVASFTNDVGLIYYSQGDYARALESYRKALGLAETLRDARLYAQGMMNVGDVLRSQGDYAQAAELYQQALQVVRRVFAPAGIGRLNDRVGMATLLLKLGQAQAAQGGYAQALESYRESLRLFKATPVEFVAEGTAAVLNHTGNVYTLQGNYAEAQKYYGEARELSERLGIAPGVARALNNSANVCRLQGDQARALESADRAASLARQIGDRETLWSARTTAGEAHRAAGRDAKAVEAFEEAIATIESLRASFAGREARASYFATVRKPYESYIDLLMQTHRQRPADGHDARALQASERARARTLLEALTEAGADIRQGVDAGLLERERDLQHQLNAAARRQAKFFAGARAAEREASSRKEIDGLTSQLRTVQEEIRRKSPRYAALTQPEPLGLAEIQKQVLDDDTLLLEYALGEERSYLWAVTRAGLKSYELPKRAEIEDAARLFYDLITSRNRRVGRDPGAARLAPGGAANVSEAAARLSQLILAPVAAELGTKRLVIVGDGALQYVPFAALPDPAGARAAAGVGQPLVVAHEIVSLPSATALSVLRREFAGRPAAPRAVAVLADPVFEQSDERVTRASAAGNGKAAGAAGGDGKPAAKSAASRTLLERAFPAQRSGDPADGEKFLIARLPFTSREARDILAVAPADAAMLALNFRASRETATGGELAQYRIVHFATHGILNSEHPELSGVVLSLFDERGQPADGCLRLHEIYNLKLPAELVVLSACQTALGKEIKGEGLVGLTRGFMYAGSPRVVASLWQVDDVATAELMKLFYEAMLRKDGLRPAAALRAAQQEMLNKGGLQSHWREPYYWAAFQLQGEWK